MALAAASAPDDVIDIRSTGVPLAGQVAEDPGAPVVLEDGTVIFRSRETDGSVDLNGDGDIDDHLLLVFDSATGTVRLLDESTLPAGLHRLEGGRVAYVAPASCCAPELRVTDVATGDVEVVDPRVASEPDIAPLVGGGLSYLIDERRIGADHDGDGLHDSKVAVVVTADGGSTVVPFPVIDQTPLPGGLLAIRSGVERDTFPHQLPGELLVHDVASGLVTRTGVVGHTVMAMSGGLVGFVAHEPSEELDRNGDGDTEDSVLVLIDTRTGAIRAVGPTMPSSSWELPGPIVNPSATRALIVVDEHTEGVDLDGNGRVSDLVHHTIDLVSGDVTNLEMSIFSGPVHGRLLPVWVDDDTAMLPHSIGDHPTDGYGLFRFDVAVGATGDTGLRANQAFVDAGDGTISMVILEQNVGRDANGDGDLDDDALILYDIVTDEIQQVTSGRSPVGMGRGRVAFTRQVGDSFHDQGVFVAAGGQVHDLGIMSTELTGTVGGRLLVAAGESQALEPVDLTGDGDLLDHVLQIVDLDRVDEGAPTVVIGDEVLVAPGGTVDLPLVVDDSVSGGSPISSVVVSIDGEPATAVVRDGRLDESIEMLEVGVTGGQESAVREVCAVVTDSHQNTVESCRPVQVTVVEQPVITDLRVSTEWTRSPDSPSFSAFVASVAPIEEATLSIEGYGDTAVDWEWIEELEGWYVGGTPEHLDLGVHEACMTVTAAGVDAADCVPFGIDNFSRPVISELRLTTSSGRRLDEGDSVAYGDEVMVEIDATDNVAVVRGIFTSGGGWPGLLTAPGVDRFGVASGTFEGVAYIDRSGPLRVCVVAVDGVDNRSDEVCRQVVVDAASPPVIDPLSVSPTPSRTDTSVSVRASVSDDTVVTAAYYSLDGAAWQELPARDGAADSAVEVFGVEIDGLAVAVGRRRLCVRAFDEFDNLSDRCMTFDHLDRTGPTTTDLVIGRDTLSRGTSLSVRALIDDSGAGASVVLGGSWEIRDGDGQPVHAAPLTAEDGDFDAATEAVVGEVSGDVTSALAPGDHELCVSGSDASANEGAAECRAFTVLTDLAEGDGTITSRLPGSSDATFALAIERDATTLGGVLQFRDVGLAFVATSVESLAFVDGDAAVAEGRGELNLFQSCEYRLTVVRTGAPSEPDGRFTLELACGISGAQILSFDGPLTSGQVTVRGA